MQPLGDSHRSYERREQKANITLEEALQRESVVRHAREYLDGLPNNKEAHSNARDELLEQAEHYQKITDGLLKLIGEDFNKY